MNRHTRRSILRLPFGALIIAAVARCTPGTPGQPTLTLAEIISDVTDIVNGLVAEAGTLENLVPGSAALIQQIIADAQAALQALQSVTTTAGASGIIQTIIGFIPQILQILQTAGVNIPTAIQTWLTFAATLAQIILPILGLAVPATIAKLAKPDATRDQAKAMLRSLRR